MYNYNEGDTMQSKGSRPPINISELQVKGKIEKPRPSRGGLSYLEKDEEPSEVIPEGTKGKESLRVVAKPKKKVKFNFTYVLLVGASVALSLVLITQLAPSKKLFTQLWNTVYSHQKQIAALETKIGQMNQTIENINQSQSQYAKINQLPGMASYEAQIKTLQDQITLLQKNYSDLLDTVNKMKSGGK